MDKIRNIEEILSAIYNMLQEIKEDTEYLKGFIKDYQIPDISERKEQGKEKVAQEREKRGDDKISIYHEPQQKTASLSEPEAPLKM